MKNYTALIYLALCALILSPLMFFPVSHDLSMFIQGGRVIAGGGRMYVDFIDLKPPFIYYFYAAIDLLCGTTAFAARTVDYFMQLLTAFLLLRIVNKYMDIPNAAGFSALVYCLSYISLAVGNTTQVESLAGLPLAGLIYFQLKDNKTNLTQLLIGLFAGILISMKFTLGIVVVPIMIDWLTDGFKPAKIIKDTLMLGCGIILALFIFFLPLLLDGQMMRGYADVMEYLAKYSSGYRINAVHIREITKYLTYFLGSIYTPLFIIFTFAGLYYTLTIRRGKSKNWSFLRFSASLVIFLSLTVALEGKYFLYHYSRMFLPLSILTATGFSAILSKIKETWSSGDLFRRLMIACFAVLVFFISPLPNLSKLMELPVARLVSREKAYNFFKDSDPRKLSNPDDQKTILDMIRQELSPKEKAIIVSSCSGAMNYGLNYRNVACLPNSYFYMGSLAIDGWKQRIRNERDRYKFVIVQSNDDLDIMIGQPISSWDLFNRDSSFKNYVLENFEIALDLGNYKVFQRKSFAASGKQEGIEQNNPSVK
jgi:hypothetical protein